MKENKRTAVLIRQPIKRTPYIYIYMTTMKLFIELAQNPQGKKEPTMKY